MSHELSDGSLYSHYKHAKDIDWRWKNFTAEELSCKYSGEYYHHPRTLDALQSARDMIGSIIRINSGHRSWMHNIAVGGSPLSAHRYMACDISLINHDERSLFRALQLSGFKSFGFYNTFIHADLRDGRKWYGSTSAKRKWQSLLDELDLQL